MKYAFMAAHLHEHHLGRMAQVLGVSRSGYYAWQARQSSEREKANQALLEQIRQVHAASRQTYGAPRIQAALRQQGVFCSRKRVAHLMRQHQLIGRAPQRRHPHTTQRDPAALPAPNRLNQEFEASLPNRKWVADITYIATAEGWLYLAAVLDLYSRQIVGWAMGEQINAQLVQAALQMAWRQRHPKAGWLHHSDQGRQYTSELYRQCLAAYRGEASMSRVGNCYDNAVMESFFATLKAECAPQPFASRAQARSAIFEYIEGWYNRVRLHSTLGYLSPLEFEQSGH
jgi:transposase InsO family protein